MHEQRCANPDICYAGSNSTGGRKRNSEMKLDGWSKYKLQEKQDLQTTAAGQGHLCGLRTCTARLCFSLIQEKSSGERFRIPASSALPPVPEREGKELVLVPGRDPNYNCKQGRMGSWRLGELEIGGAGNQESWRLREMGVGGAGDLGT